MNEWNSDEKANLISAITRTLRDPSLVLFKANRWSLKDQKGDCYSAALLVNAIIKQQTGLQRGCPWCQGSADFGTYEHLRRSANAMLEGVTPICQAFVAYLVSGIFTPEQLRVKQRRNNSTL